MPRIPIPPIEGVSDTPSGPPPLMDFLSTLARPSPGKKGSAQMGREALAALERWASADQRMAPRISEAIEILEGSRPDSQSSDSDRPEATHTGDALGGLGELKSPI